MCCYWLFCFSSCWMKKIDEQKYIPKESLRVLGTTFLITLLLSWANWVEGWPIVRQNNVHIIMSSVQTNNNGGVRVEIFSPIFKKDRKLMILTPFYQWTEQDGFIFDQVEGWKDGFSAVSLLEYCCAPCWIISHEGWVILCKDLRHRYKFLPAFKRSFIELYNSHM